MAEKRTGRGRTREKGNARGRGAASSRLVSTSFIKTVRIQRRLVAVGSEPRGKPLPGRGDTAESSGKSVLPGVLEG